MKWYTIILRTQLSIWCEIDKKSCTLPQKIILINLNDQQKIISRCVVKNICKILIANRNYLCLLKRDYHEVHFKMDA